MNKQQITDHLIEILREKKGSNFNPSLYKLINLWVDPRNNHMLRLSENGFKAFQEAEIKAYQVKFPKEFKMFNILTNQWILDLHRHVKHPFYLTEKAIMLFNQKEAVELILYGGELGNYVQTKKQRAIKALDND